MDQFTLCMCWQRPVKQDNKISGSTCHRLEFFSSKCLTAMFDPHVILKKDVYFLARPAPPPGEGARHAGRFGTYPDHRTTGPLPATCQRPPHHLPPSFLSACTGGCRRLVVLCRRRFRARPRADVPDPSTQLWICATHTISPRLADSGAALFPARVRVQETRWGLAPPRSIACVGDHAQRGLSVPHLSTDTALPVAAVSTCSPALLPLAR